MDFGSLKLQIDAILDEIQERFPQFSLEEAKQWAKFVVLSGAAIREANDVLPTGSTLNGKGIELCLREVAKHVFEKE